MSLPEFIGTFILCSMFGWWLRGYIDGRLLALMIRVITSKMGKEKVRAMLLQALAEYEGKTDE